MNLSEIYQKYAGVDCHLGCDKGTVHSYIDVYERLFAPYRTSARSVVEIGLMSGHSLRMWESYFATDEVYGVDCSETPHDGLADLRPMITEKNHLIKILDATSYEAVRKAFKHKRFDVVIDDASHVLEHQLAIYANFKDWMTTGGIYVIEDVQDIDTSRTVLESIDPKKTIEVIDLRHVKGRYDDVLVVIR